MNKHLSRFIKLDHTQTPKAGHDIRGAGFTSLSGYAQLIPRLQGKEADGQSVVTTR